MRDGKGDGSARGINSRIAARVGGLRRERGMSLDSLAARSGASRSMISLVERGESSPTAALLEKIAAGLGVPLASLFDDGSAAPSPLSRRADRTAWRDPQTGYVRRNISPPNFASPIRIVDVVLPAGARVAYEGAGRDASIHQQIWAREGTVEIAAGGSTHRLREDDCLAMRLEGPVAFSNPGRGRARYTVVVASEGARAPRR